MKKLLALLTALTFSLGAYAADAPKPADPMPAASGATDGKAKKTKTAKKKKTEKKEKAVEKKPAA